VFPALGIVQLVIVAVILMTTIVGVVFLDRAGFARFLRGPFWSMAC